MALHGTLEDFSLADIFQLVGIQRKTGILTLKNSHETITIFFHNGMIIGADTSPKKLEDRLGKVLVKTGLISVDQLKEALDYQQKTLQKIGFILVDQRYLTREQLKEALQIQVVQMIYRLFRWNSGEYMFDQKVKVDPNADDAVPPMSAESILMEGIQMIDEWPLIQKRIPNFSIVFRPTVGVDDLVLESEEVDEIDALLSGNPLIKDPADAEKARLNREEEAIFRLVNGKNTVAEIIERSKMGEFHTCKTLYDLLIRRLIEQVQSAEPVVSKQLVVDPVFVPAPRSASTGFLYPILALVIAGALFLRPGDPLGVLWHQFAKPEDKMQMKADANQSRFNLVDSSIVGYYYINGKLPRALPDLVAENYLRDEDVKDVWSRPFLYRVSGLSYQLSASTQDGNMDHSLSVNRTMTALSPLVVDPKHKPAQRAGS